MKKYIVLSVNDNPDYLYFTPLVCWAWRKFGWESILFHHGKNGPNNVRQLALTIAQPDQVALLEDQNGYRSDTITQVSRLYACCLFPGSKFTHSYPDSLLMTGDIDMIPLSNYWQPKEDNVTVYGHDLTGFGHVPICYVSMPSMKWKEVMGGIGHHQSMYNEFIKRDLDKSPQAKNDDFYKYWFTDQDLLTGYLNIYGKDKITFINRGQYSNGYARGRVDRGAWSLNHSEFIDCHMFQQLYFKQNQDKFDKTMELLTSIWPDEDFGWFYTYTEEFRKLTGQA